MYRVVEEDRVLCIVLWFADHVSPTTLRERCVDFFFPFSLHLHFCTYIHSWHAGNVHNVPGG
jgi:hypothetical protein